MAQQESAKDVVEKFGQTTTLHGVRGICDGASHIIQRVLWTLLVFSALLVYSVVAYFSIRSYLQYHSVTKITSKATESLEFPAVTICDQNKLPYSALQSYNSSTAGCIIKGLLSGVSNEDTACLEVLEQYTIVDVLVTNRMALFDSMFIECTFNQAVLDCRDYFKPVIAESGTCFMFTPGPLKQTASGILYGLTVVIDARVDDYYVSSRDGVGVQVSIHDPKYFPSVDEYGFALEPGIDAYVAIQKSVDKTLNVPYSELPCHDQESPTYENMFLQQIGFTEYSYGSCRFNCLYDYSVKSCGCELSAGNTECSLLEYVNCTAVKVIEFYQRYENSTCNCSKLCTEVQYDYQVSEMSYPTPYTLIKRQAANMPPRSMEDLRENMISLNIYFNSIEFETVEQVPSKPLGELIADIGGQLGLFLGASLISVFEILEFMFVMIKTKLQSRTKVTMVEEFKTKY